MDARQLIEALGLTEKEADVYMALLPRGQAPASAIAKVVNLPRTTTRFTLEQLVEKGLISETNDHNTTIYLVEDPNRLKKLLEKERKDIERREAQLDTVLGNLKDLYNPSSIIPQVKFYDGIDGTIDMLKEVFAESDLHALRLIAANLEQNDPFPADVVRELTDYLTDHFEYIHLIRGPSDKRGLEPIEKRGKCTIERRFHNKLTDYAMDMYIFEQRLALVARSGRLVQGLSIENRVITKEFGKLFTALWEGSHQEETPKAKKKK